MSKESRKKDGTIITQCACAHVYQDRVYGKGMRVHNCGKEGNRCTVCRVLKG